MGAAGRPGGGGEHEGDKAGGGGAADRAVGLGRRQRHEMVSAGWRSRGGTGSGGIARGKEDEQVREDPTSQWLSERRLPETILADDR